ALWCFCVLLSAQHRDLLAFPTRRSSDLTANKPWFRRSKPVLTVFTVCVVLIGMGLAATSAYTSWFQSDADFVEVPSGLLPAGERSEEHTSELQSRFDLVCRLLLEKKKHT